MSSNDVVLSCKNIKKSYVTGDTTTHALRGVDLEVKRGELLMLVGPSGCGKTTLISIMAGILNYDQGSCNVFGRELNTMSERERTKFRGETIGFVFQAFNLIPTLTAAENVSVPLLIGGARSEESIEKAKVLLGRVGLEGKDRSKPSQLSGGQQQRVATARALVHDPKIIVCDEPTSALDQETGHRIMEIFREVALEHGRTLIIVTHDNRIFQFADRIAYMNDGMIAEIQTPPFSTVH